MTHRPRRSRIPAVVALAVVLSLAATGPASACATCFGADDSALTQGMNGAILTLLGVIGVVQVGFVAMFTNFVLRSKRLRRRKEHFRVIRGGSS